MPGFLKRYTDAAQAAEALRRTRILRAQSVRTPAATPGPTVAELDFDNIDGSTGHDLIGYDLRPLLQSVAALHRASVPGLASYDPLLRIRPRLALTEVPILREIADGPAPHGNAVLHGDLHVGQFIVTPDSAVWVVDLDDLAVGPPEADLANFVAHLATTDTRSSIADWARRVCDAWDGVGQIVDGHIFTRYLRFGLLRRHLKLREAGRPDFEEAILTYLRESSSFSIR
ncbi:MAG: phosphotransferase [Rhodobacteraceae bacterium]|nr:phosphotransferase [Paracoccaceae bacterium]